MEQKTYYFVGIKGTGMASLARILHDKGHRVLGSDIEKETFTQAPLLQAGIKILPFDPANLESGMIVIQGNAFDDDHPEIKRAHELGLQILSYPEAVEKEVKSHTSIGIAGAHGKTSTTALLSHVLAAVEPTSYLIGDGVGKGNADARFFVFEADEYRDHFLAYRPDYAIMTNIDFDHPDYFKDINDVRDSFETYGKQVQRAIFAWGDDQNLRQLNVDVPVYYYGTNPDDDFRAENIQRTPAGSTYDAYFRDQKLGTFTIHLYGEHSVLNSLAVLAVAYMEHMNMDEIKQELANFIGVKRRFSESDIADMTIIDDYAHHPSEIKATIDAARQKYPDRQIITVFQPHTYSRLAAYIDGFAKSLSRADKTFVTPIFGSIRENAGNVSSADLEQRIDGSEGIDMDTLDKLLQYHNAVVVFMGAGDVEKYEDKYKELLK
ncbi:UDP-N-acetylmuramate--L-alanine ligase [Lactobacillus sp. 0.1XD8-4]|uniref:UDP-N-acetylmuramate--L-alanine ligase n=1 Tax=uncultured Limosilactobacillus sp. TaxID=2837629 RepID=UPI00129DF36F|nr:UDP-N-acetylmuramate--L-alanine ligase [uncultured Limosilactobacillus sp.]MRN07288.1 UDP-N-acetylmuramate--L-alanine ligase [Lactobacillus sp. 0.1XD8-4]